MRGKGCPGGAGGRGLLGDAAPLARDRVAMMSRWSREHGDIAGLRLGRFKAVALYGEWMVEHIERLLAGWKHGQRLDAHEEMTGSRSPMHRGGVRRSGGSPHVGDGGSAVPVAAHERAPPRDRAAHHPATPGRHADDPARPRGHRDPRR